MMTVGDRVLDVFVVYRKGTVFQIHEQRVYGPGSLAAPEGFEPAGDAEMVFTAKAASVTLATLGECRRWMAEHRPDLVRMARHASDDVSIVETYI